MQLKLLNFHKMMSNFATNLVGGFIPLIIYKHTHSLFLAVGYLALTYLLQCVHHRVFKKLYIKQPQLMLLIRVFPILIYSLAIILIEFNLWLGVILTAIFTSMSSSFKSNATEFILNYSISQKTKSKSFGLTRVFEQLGSIISYIAGGLFLDHLPAYVLIIIAMVIYLISVVPLLIYYVRFKKEKGFNAELVSNATLMLSQREDTTTRGKKVSKRILFNYGLMYYLLGFLDQIANLFSILCFVKYGEFAMAGYFSAAYHLAYALGSYIVSLVGDKFDTTIISAVFLCVNGVCAAILPFVESEIAIYSLFALIGIVYPFYSLFLIERMLAKTRILGISNKALYIRNDVSSFAQSSVCWFGLFGTVIPSFIAMCVCLVTCGILLPIGEEKTRKELVNYLECNE